MKTLRPIIFCALALTGTAQAASDGSLSSSSSTGQTQIGITANVSAPAQVKISGLGDYLLDFGDTEYEQTSTVVNIDELPLCVYSSAPGGFTIEAISSNTGTGDHQLQLNGGMGEPAGSYNSVFTYPNDGSGSGALLRHGPGNFTDISAMSDENCSGTGGTNASLKLYLSAASVSGSFHQYIEDNNLFGTQFTFSDILSLTVTPNL